MSIGFDIADVFTEIGTQFNIKVASVEADVTGGYLDFEMNRQVTKPFIREVFLECFFAYDTLVEAGDVIEFQDGTGRRFMVMNKTQENFENEAILYEGVLYKCNVSGELSRPSGEVFDSNYRQTTAWESIRTEAFALLSDRLFGTDLEQDEPVGQFNIESQLLYLPHSYGVQQLDRYSPRSGEYYKVETIATRRFDQVDVCYLAEDTRP